eukprot:TRINITY_DN3123_c0_g1_i1.p2 TRINITY_DN3123_c0_g1~~TRINITY_DN3123_c0_g1_i1.p2  ORF type:complete len:169 (-),score=9.45 TRINITY_DN3123_c0_g1_i1:373-879(-)
MASTDYVTLAGFIAVPIVQGFFSGLVFGGGDSEWYKKLRKPTWTPPGWAFPVIWTALYILMGIAAWLVYLKGGFEAQKVPLAVYGFQLFLNFLWTPLFFYLKRIDWAVAEIVILWYAILCNIATFWRIDRIAALLLVPYFAWVTTATRLNWYIYQHNTPGKDPNRKVD